MKALKLAGLAGLAAAAIAGCGGGSGSSAPVDSAAPGVSSDVPADVSQSWPAMYGYLLAALVSAPDDKEPAKVTGEVGPTSDVVEAEANP